jgi:hypothetical protein
MPSWSNPADSEFAPVSDEEVSALKKRYAVAMAEARMIRERLFRAGAIITEEEEAAAGAAASGLPC